MPGGATIRRRVLFIEDHDDTRLLYGTYFEAAGYVVETASCGNDGIAAALRMDPDVIVVDLAMPSLDGWDAIALLRTYPSTATKLIIACTAVDSEDALDRARAMGCDAIVRKPCLPLEIEAAVEARLGGRVDVNSA